MSEFTTVSGLQDLLAHSYSGAAFAYGLDKIGVQLTNDLGVYNQLINEIISTMAEKVEVQSRVFEGAATGSMGRVGEIGSSRTKDEVRRYECAYRVDKYSESIGFTYDFLMSASAESIDRKFKNMQLKHQRAIMKEFQRSFYIKDNLTFLDKTSDNKSLTIKKFWNNDSVDYPFANTSGSAFASTHDHYIPLAGASISNDDIDGICTLVQEHDQNMLTLYVNPSDVATITTLSKFEPAKSSYMTYNATDVTTVTNQVGAPLNNKTVGVWDGNYLVKTVPWAIQGYVVALADEADPKPIAYRSHPNPALRGLAFVEDNDNNKVITNEAVDWFGFSVGNRDAGAILYTSGSSTYVDPTI